MYTKIFGLLLLFCSLGLFAQNEENFVPHRMTTEELSRMPDYLSDVQSSGILTPPSSPIRTAAEWEEAEALVIAWTSFPGILREIVRHAKEEVEVIIVCDNPSNVVNYLNNGDVDTTNVTLLQEDFNSIWIRDYGQWNAYTDDVDSLILVDWIYNRPRPADDAVPESISELYDLPLYQTTAPPYDLVHTGGNFMTDGLGTGFSSNLVLDENDKTIGEIDDIMEAFMGIDRYIKMPVLPYDQIHHIDMHMKLLDEETLLISEYPTGVADGPQIEANIEYIQNNFTSAFGTPYKIVRIPAPDENGTYPNQGGDYRTFTNSVFINKTVLVPVYNSQYEADALALYEALLPGYNIVGIDCNDIIPLSGALHCITKLVHTDDPLLIVHQPLTDNFDSTTTEFTVNATVQHRSDIETAQVFYRTDATQDFEPLAMEVLDPMTSSFTVNLPAQLDSTTVQYYIDATSYSGKSQVRPMPAPEGFWSFTVYNGLTEFEDTMEVVDSMNVALNLIANTSLQSIQNIYPNPIQDYFVLDVRNDNSFTSSIVLFDVNGKEVDVVYTGAIGAASQSIVYRSTHLVSGVYFLHLQSPLGLEVRKIFIE